MKALASLLWVSAYLEAYNVLGEALVYTPSSLSRQAHVEPPSISPHTARLLFAQRLGLSQYHSLQGADPLTLDILNTHGGEQKPIFDGEETTRGTKKLLLVVEGVGEEIFDQAAVPAFKIEPQPSSSQNLELTIELLNQDRDSKQKGENPCYIEVPGLLSVRGGFSSLGLGSHDCKAWYSHLNYDESGALRQPTLSTLKHGREAFGSGAVEQTSVFHITSLQALTPKDGDLYHQSLSEIKKFIDELLEDGQSISYTIVLMPPAHQDSKRSASSLHASYKKPLLARQQQPEEPLYPSATASSSSSPHDVNPLQTSASPLPHGILPVCHSSLQSCITATNNCSGHGTPYKKSSGLIDCFACKCSKTVITDDEGRKKTVYWGGPACQKKDISVPFFLLAGLSIALIGVVTWGVGLMASVGQEELPSVIGAGVAGPRAQK